MVPPAIAVEGVVKNFGPKQVLKNISFNVRNRTIHGYLGHNAAGKTTTIRIALGLLTADKGSAKIFGEDLQERPEFRAQIGYVSEGLGLYSSHSVKENLIRFCDLYGKDPKSALELIQELDLQEFADVPVKKLSAGTKQRLAIARALAGSPRLLILDEPFSNLDPVKRHKLKEKFKTMRKDGCTIFMATHILSDVEELCDDVTIIKEGKILFSGTIERLRRKVNLKPSVRISTSNNLKAHRILSKNYAVTRSGDGTLIVEAVEKDEIPRISQAITKLGIYELTLKEPSLEAIYATLHEGKK